MAGVVEIAPSEVAAVCQAGYQLEVICSTPSVLHTWQLIANPESGAVTPLRQVSSVGSPGVESEPIIINSTTMITFSRLSSSPLTSRMTINPVSEGLNGSRVNCVDGETSESATTTILIIGGRLSWLIATPMLHCDYVTQIHDFRIWAVLINDL